MGAIVVLYFLIASVEPLPSTHPVPILGAFTSKAFSPFVTGMLGIPSPCCPLDLLFVLCQQFATAGCRAGDTPATSRAGLWGSWRGGDLEEKRGYNSPRISSPRIVISLVSPSQKMLA